MLTTRAFRFFFFFFFFCLFFNFHLNHISYILLIFLNALWLGNEYIDRSSFAVLYFFMSGIDLYFAVSIFDPFSLIELQSYNLWFIHTKVYFFEPPVM